MLPPPALTNAPTVGGFLRTYARDAPFLTYSLRSICKFAFPTITHQTVVYPQSEAALFRTLLRGFPWAHAVGSDADARVADAFALEAGKPAPRGAGKSFIVPGVGYIAQILDKMLADTFLPAPADYIIYFDSDTFLPRPLLPMHLFNASAATEPSGGSPGGGSFVGRVGWRVGFGRSGEIGVFSYAAESSLRCQ